MLLLGPVGTEEAGRGGSCSRSSSSHSCRDPRAGGLLRLRGGARDAQGNGGRETLVPGTRTPSTVTGSEEPDLPLSSKRCLWPCVCAVA